MESSPMRSFETLPDLAVLGLDTTEQFVVGVARCWDAFLGDPDPTLAWRELAPVFTYMDVLGALCAFDTAFRVVDDYRLPALTFHEVDSTQVGLAEARLLCGLASLQSGNVRAASSALAGALSSRGIHALLPPLARIASILAVKGHFLPPWRDTPAALTGAAPLVSTAPQWPARQLSR
jgi:hypothetical protein